MVNFDPDADPGAQAELDALWAELTSGGAVLMPLQEYPFSPRYGWVQDRYGVSWQLMLAPAGQHPRERIVPCLMFGRTVQGCAAEAISLYVDTFAGTRGAEALRPPGDGAAGQILYADFQAYRQWFAVMDAPGQAFTYSPGVSLVVHCAGQGEIDRLWRVLSAVPEAEACGWCADRFGISWQVVPDTLGKLMATPDAYPTLMTMKKIEISAFN